MTAKRNTGRSAEFTLRSLGVGGVVSIEIGGRQRSEVRDQRVIGDR